MQKLQKLIEFPYILYPGTELFELQISMFPIKDKEKQIH